MDICVRVAFSTRTFSLELSKSFSALNMTSFLLCVMILTGKSISKLLGAVTASVFSVPCAF